MRFLKLISFAFIMALLFIVVYQFIIKYFPKVEVDDNSRLENIMDTQKVEFTNRSYEELLTFMVDTEDSAYLHTVTKHGISYTVEVSSYWLNEFEKGGDLIVYFTVYTSDSIGQNPLRDTILKRK
jgi:hypothetical protein